MVMLECLNAVYSNKQRYIIRIPTAKIVAIPPKIELYVLDLLYSTSIL
jgi:hypothetical protein